MKKVISFAMALIMLFGMVPVPAGAETILETSTAEEPAEQAVQGDSGETLLLEDSPTESEEAAEAQPEEEPAAVPELLTCGEYFYTLLADGSVSICGFIGVPEDSDKPFLVEIPDTMADAAVTEIAEGAFAGNSKINAVLLPETIQVVGSGAFENCANLKVIAFCGDAPAFGETAVKGCEALEEIYVLKGRDFSALEAEWEQEIRFRGFENETALEEAFAALGNDGFEEEQTITAEDAPVSVLSEAETIASGTCGKNLTWVLDSEGTLTISGTGDMSHFSYRNTPWYNIRERIKRLVIGEGVTFIGENSFSGCSNLVSLSIPDSVTSIGAEAFNGCFSLPEVIIPSSVTSIGSRAFSGCSSLPEVVIPSSVTSIGYEAFESCSLLSDITIPGSVTSLDDRVFGNCSGLVSATIEDGVISIGGATFSNCSKLESVTIPDSVTSIGSSAFYGCSSLTSLTIPDSVTSIGDGTFMGCAKLTQMTIPDGVASIGEKTFYNCSSLTSLSIPDSVTSIGNLAFWYCSSLSDVIIPSSVSFIGHSAFYCCSSLTRLSVPSTVSSIEDYTFRGCSSLNELIIQNGVTSIGDYSFEDCSSLTTLSIPDSVTSIGNRAFFDCSSLSDVIIPGNISSIGNSAFYRCVSLTSLSIPESIASIGNSAFSGCSKLTSLSILGSISTIGDSMFQGCSSLKSLLIPDSIISIGESAFSGCASLASLTIPDGVASIGESAFSGCASLASLTIPDGVASIGDGAFRGCSNLASLTIPDGVASIGDGAFRGCSNLEGLTIPDGVTSIGYAMFESCSSLTNLSIPDSVTTIGDYAFYGCSKLSNVDIPNNVTAIGNRAFYGCSSLIALSIPNGIPSIESYTFHGCSKLTTLSIPNSVTSIGDYAFYNCSSLTALSIPNSVTSIGDYAFYNCSGLTSLTIPNSISSIGNYVFSCCYGITSLTLPDSVSEIGVDAFCLCISLDSLTLPDNITAIGEGAFSGCSSLRSVTIPNSVTFIDTNLFRNCSSLVNIILSDSLTSIGDYAFEGCSKLHDVYYSGTADAWSQISIGSNNSLLTNAAIHYNSTGPAAAIVDYGSCGANGDNLTWTLDSEGTLTISGAGDMCTYYSPEKGTGAPWYSRSAEVAQVIIESGVTSIGNFAFYNCGNLNNAAISGSVSVVGDQAFSGCSNLCDVYYSGTTGEWDKIHIGSDNTSLTAAVIHYSGTGAETTQYVYYFKSWDADTQTAHWGKNGSSISELNAGSQVTEETDTSFLENINDLIGTYVLAETRSRGEGVLGPDILISIKPVETRLGILKARSDDKKTIAIDDATYPLPEWTLTAAAVDDVVMYHLYEGGLVGTVTKQDLSMNGTVTEWNAATSQITIDSAQYALTAFADAGTLETLGETGEKKLSVVYYMDDGVVYKVRPYLTQDPFYGSLVTTESNPSQYYLIQYYNDWESAYEKFISAVGTALDNYIGKSEVTREHTIKEEAARMKAHDHRSSNRYITGSLGPYENAAYTALATYFYEEVDNYMVPDLSSIDATDAMSGAQLVNTIRKNIGGNPKEYVIDGVTFEIVPAVNAFGTTFGKMVIDGNQTVVICSTEQECKDTINAYVNELRDLTTSTIYKAVSSVCTDILGKSLYDLTEDYLNRVAAKIEKKCAVKLATEFNLAGVGDLFGVLDTCYTYYSWVKNAVDTGKTEDIQDTVSNIIDLKFEDATIKDAAVKAAMKQLEKASQKMNRAFNEYLDGTIVEKEHSFWRMLIGCPVNAAVYNSAGEQIGYIGEDELWSTDSLIINRIGSAKEIIMLDNNVPSLVITATDYGEMSCTFEEYDDISSPIGRLNYYSIPLTPGKKFSVALTDNIAENAGSLTIESGIEAIHADEYIAISDNATVSITCACEGIDNAEICGTGTYIRGDIAVLSMKPQDGCEFLGWYENGILVSNRTAYEFTVKEDRSLTAKFLKKELVHVDTISTDGGVTVGGGVYDKGRSVYVLALPLNGYAFSGWYLGNELLSTEREYRIEAQSDISLEARFALHKHQYGEPAFSWREDNTCVATFTCAGCDSIRIIECCVSSITIPKTEWKIGKTVYTATVTLNGATYSDIKEVPEPLIQIEQDYIILSIGKSTQLSVNASSDALADMIMWSAEDAAGADMPQTILLVDSDGTITAQRAGTAYVIASVTIDGVTYSARCRVDVTEKQANQEVTGVQLGTTALTAELFRTDYAELDVILQLKQNLMQSQARTVFSAPGAKANNGVSIDDSRFENEKAAALFDLVVKDDRTLLVVPKEEAINNPKTVAGKYVSKVIVNVDGKEFVTDASLTLTVKKSTPKLKAAALTFNTFYTSQSQAIQITGATVTEIIPNEAKNTVKTSAVPSWLTLSEGILTLNNTPAKSSNVYVKVKTAEWAIPADVTVSVKAACTAPKLKLSAPSATFAAGEAYEASQGVTLKLQCANKNDTLEGLNISHIQAPKGFEIQNFDRTDGSFILKPTEAVTAGTKEITVSFLDTTQTVILKSKVSTKAVSITAKPSTVTLNSVVGDSAAIPLTASLADYQISDVNIRLAGSRGEAIAQDLLAYEYGNGFVIVRTVKGKTQPNTTYKLYVSTKDTAKETVLTVKTLADTEKMKPTVSAKVSGSIDLSFPESCAVVTPVFKNYASGAVKGVNWTVTESKGKTLVGDATDKFSFSPIPEKNQLQLSAKDGLVPGNTYLLSLTYTLSDDSTCSCTAKITVKRTPVKLKLSKTSLSLNRKIGDTAVVDVTCQAKGYDFTQPVAQLILPGSKDGQDIHLNVLGSQEPLTVSWSGGKLTVTANATAEAGKTYKVVLQATEKDPAVTLSVKILEAPVTAALKASGAIDVVRDSTAITVTPTYKNYMGLSNINPVLTIESWSGKKGEDYQPVAEGLFGITPNANGTFTITKVPGAEADTTLKYRAKLTFDSCAKPAYVNLAVKSGTAKVVVSNSIVLYKTDRFSRGTFRITSTDKNLNPVEKVTFKTASHADLYALYNYGNGEFAIGFKDNTVQTTAKYPTSVGLNVFYEGNNTNSPNAAVTLKLTAR